MEPIFMYWNEVKFEGDNNYKKFIVNFNDEDRLDGVIFRKRKNYYIISLTTDIKIEKKISKLADYEKIKETSKKFNEVLKNGPESLYENIELKIQDVNDLQPIKTNRKKSTKSLEFFDEKTEKKKQILIYSPYKELKYFGLHFEKRNAIIDKYEINLVEDDKKNYFLEKKLFYDKRKIIEVIKKKYLYQNMFFMEDKGKLIVQPIDLTDIFVSRIESFSGKSIDWTYLLRYIDQFRYLFNSALFKNRNVKIFQKGHNVNDSHPIAYDYRNGNFTIKGGVNFYITKELNEKKQSIFRNIDKIPEKIVTSTELDDLRRQVNDDSFKAPKLFGFRSTTDSIFTNFTSRDIIIPDFNVKVETQKKSDGNEKKIYEGSFFMLDNDYNQSKITRRIFSTDRNKQLRSATIKNTFSEEEEKYLNKDYNLMKKKTEINVNSLNLVYENFFLYDLNNFIRPSYTTELQTDFNIYGLVNFSSKTDKENEKLHIISPKNYLKFNTIDDTHKNDLKIELTKVHTKKTFEIVDNKAYNFGILCTENEKVGEKRKMKEEILDVIQVIGIQNNEYQYLNPIHIHIKSERIIRRLMLKKNNKYRFILTSAIFSSNIINETETIFFISNGLDDAKKIFINDSLEDGLGVCYLSQIENWKLIKGESKRVQVVFNNSEKIIGQPNHLAFEFTTRNLSDILKFSVTLLDDKKKLIKFKDGEENIPIINFNIEILK